MYPMLVHDGWVGPRGNHVYQNFTGLELLLSGMLEWEEIWEWVALFSSSFHVKSLLLQVADVCLR